MRYEKCKSTLTRRSGEVGGFFFVVQGLEGGRGSGSTSAWIQEICIQEALNGRREDGALVARSS